MTQVERESMNFRLPKPLAQALRKAASPQPGKTATDIVIRALTQELGNIQGLEVCTEVRLQKLEEELQQLRSSIQEPAEHPHRFPNGGKIRSTQQPGSQIRRSVGSHSK